MQIFLLFAGLPNEKASPRFWDFDSLPSLLCLLHAAGCLKPLEEELSKQRILEIYLNVIEWGDGIYGVEAAARSYFSKSSKDLNVREAVLLAAIIPNPRRMKPTHLTHRLQFRYDLILSRMLQYHHISQEEYERAKNPQTDQ